MTSVYDGLAISQQTHPLRPLALAQKQLIYSILVMLLVRGGAFVIFVAFPHLLTFGLYVLAILATLIFILVAVARLGAACGYTVLASVSGHCDANPVRQSHYPGRSQCPSDSKTSRSRREDRVYGCEPFASVDCCGSRRPLPRDALTHDSRCIQLSFVVALDAVNAQRVASGGDGPDQAIGSGHRTRRRRAPLEHGVSL